MDWKIRLYEQLQKHEGLRLKPYLCTAGVPTIGYGSTTYMNGKKVTLQDNAITLDEAEEMLADYVDKFVFPVIKKIFNEFNSFSDNRKIALCDMLYNLGEARLRGFKKMITAIHAKNWTEAGKQAMDSSWYTQVKGRAKTNVNMLING
jgi:lysozyme